MSHALRRPPRIRTAVRVRRGEAATAQADAPTTPLTSDAPTTPLRTRRASLAARGADLTASVLLMVARVVRFVFGLIVMIIVAAIVLRVLGANSHNSIVRNVHRWGRDLSGPCKTLFSIHNPKVAIAVNWGIAAVAWSVIGTFVSGLLARLAPRRRR
jgi:hypothetical protein